MNEPQITNYLSKPYSRVLVPEPDGGFSAHVLEWPGCLGEGDTADEAMASLEASMATWVAVMLEDVRPIPEPVAREYSGKMMLRLSRELHRGVMMRAEAEGVSANQFILGAVEARLAQGAVTAAPTWPHVGWAAISRGSTEQMIIGWFMDPKSEISMKGTELGLQGWTPGKGALAVNAGMYFDASGMQKASKREVLPGGTRRG